MLLRREKKSGGGDGGQTIARDGWLVVGEKERPVSL
jgi:hypothetical protein